MSRTFAYRVAGLGLLVTLALVASACSKKAESKAEPKGAAQQRQPETRAEHHLGPAPVGR